MLLAKLEELVGLVQAEHLQRSRDLLAIVRERRQIGAFGVIAEKRVEHLLDVPQIDLNLSSDMGEQEPLLRAARHLIKDGLRGRVRRQLVLLCRVEPRHHGFDLLREFGGECRKVFDRRLGKQQRRGIFHGHWLGDRPTRQLVQSLVEPIEELR